MDTKKCANKDKTKDFFNLDIILDLRKDIKNSRKNIYSLEKKLEHVLEKRNNPDSIREKLINENLKYEKHLNKYESYVDSKFFDLVINGDFNLTSTCIARILDTTNDYVTRNLKSKIEYIYLPLKLFNVNDILYRNKEIEVYKHNIYKDKELFFSESSFLKFIKNNIYEVGDKVIYPFDISKFFETVTDEIDLDQLCRLISKFINKYTKTYEYESPISYETALSIVNSDIDLVRSSTVKRFLEHNAKTHKLLAINNAIMRKYDLESIEDVIDNESAFIDFVNSKEYYYDNHTSEIIKYKNVIPVQDIQVNRYLAKIPHVKYHLKTEDSSKPIALFDIKENEIKVSKNKYDGSRNFTINTEFNLVKIALDKTCNKDNIEKELNEFLLSNYNPRQKEDFENE